MNMKSLFLCILYELQPVRISDVIYWVRWLRENASDLFHAVVEGFEWSVNQFHVLASQGYISNQHVLFVCSWLLGWYLTNLAGFGSLWVILSMFAAIFLNLNDNQRGEGELSAYSVFNKGFQSLLGTLTAEQIDGEIRHRRRPEVQAVGGDNDNNEGDGGEKPEVVDRRHLRRGKKARRGYEDKLLRRQLQQEQDED